MNIRIVISAMMLPLASLSVAQPNSPLVRELDFEEVAQNYNTYNEKREPMSYLAGFSMEGDIQLLKKNPVQVMFNPLAKVDRGDCMLMRWDPVMRVWDKLAGNQLKNTTEGRNLYWAALIDSPGHYALMKELEKTGTTQLVLPSGCSAEEWRCVQQNMGVVCEGFAHTKSLSVPVPTLSPTARISMRYRKMGEPVQHLSDTVLGTLVSDFWKQPDAVNQTFEMSFASLK